MSFQVEMIGKIFHELLVDIRMAFLNFTIGQLSIKQTTKLRNWRLSSNLEATPFCKV